MFWTVSRYLTVLIFWTGKRYLTALMFWTGKRYLTALMFWTEFSSLTPPKDPAKIFPKILHPVPQNRSQTIVRMPCHLMAVPKTTINEVLLGILNAVN
jgi:hypothetical protein